MPRSKRNRVFNLTNVKKKPKANKDVLIEKIRETAEKYDYAYVVSAENQTSEFLRQTREILRPGRLFCGKAKVMQLACGLHPSVETQEGIHKLALELGGQHKGLLFTNSPAEKLDAQLEEFQPSDYARPGAIATRTITLEPGIDALAAFPGSMEVQLRQLGLSTILKNGIIHLLGAYVVCQEGKPIDVNHAQMLRLLDEKMTTYRMFLDCMWTRSDGSFESFQGSDSENEDAMSEDEAEVGAQE